jgi:hypothetical protein
MARLDLDRPFGHAGFFRWIDLGKRLTGLPESVLIDGVSPMKFLAELTKPLKASKDFDETETLLLWSGQATAARVLPSSCLDSGQRVSAHAIGLCGGSKRKRGGSEKRGGLRPR